MAWVTVGALEALGDIAAADLVSGPTQTRAAVDARVGTQVPPLVAQAMAADTAVRDALLAGVADAVAGMNVMASKGSVTLTTDLNTVRAISDQGSFAIRLSNTLNAPAEAALLPSSDPLLNVFIERNGNNATVQKVMSGNVTWVRMAASASAWTPWVQLITSDDVPVLLGQPRSSVTQIACVGDSLTRGNSGGSNWDLEDAYPAKLEAWLDGAATVTNHGLSGYTSDQVNLQNGLTAFRVRIPGGQILASGATPVQTSQVIGGWPDEDYPLTLPGYLEGVRGTLRRDDDGDWDFTRLSSGKAVPATMGTFRGHRPSLPAGEFLQRHTIILGYGRNDIARGVRGMESTVLDHVMRGYQDAFHSVDAREKQIVFLGTTCRTDDTPESDGYQQTHELRQRLRTLYPAHFCDLQGYLLSERVWTDTGITPTQADLDAQDSGMSPPSLFDDVTHYSRTTAQAIAQHLIGPFLQQKGWV